MAGCSPPQCQFTIDDVFRNATIISWRTWPNHRSLRCLSRVYILGRPTRDRTSAFVTLSSQDTADASQVECVESTLLPGICSPCIAAIQQCADNTGNVDRHICLHRQLGACPYSSRATSESRIKLPSQSSCRSLRPMRGCQWWWSRGRWTCRQHRVRSREC